MKSKSVTTTKKEKAFSKRFVSPVHPGKVLQGMLDDIGMSQSAFATHIRVKQGVINEICRGKRAVSLEMATRFGRAFGQDPQVWLNMQQAWELSQIDSSRFENIERIKLRA